MQIKPKVAVYARQSAVRGSVRQQIRACGSAAKKAGWTVLRIAND